MKSTTTIRTEYAPAGLKADGTWRTIGLSRYPTPESAEDALTEYKRNSETRPNLWPPYKEYTVRMRTTVTTICEWEDVPGRPAKSE